jgi:hypothetical protein
VALIGAAPLPRYAARTVFVCMEWGCIRDVVTSKTGFHDDVITTQQLWYPEKATTLPDDDDDNFGAAQTFALPSV